MSSLWWIVNQVLLTYLVFVHLWFLHFVLFSLHMDIHMLWRVGVRKMGHNIYLMEKEPICN